MVMMMPSSSGEGRSSSPMEANAVAAVSVDTKLMVTAQQLKDLLSKEDSTANPLPTVTMNPLILSWACSGSWQDLELLLNSESGPSVRYNQEFLDLLTAYSSDSCIDKSASAQKASEDVEASLNQLPSVSAVSLLEGVTIEGSTALHMVATYGDVDGFLRSADIIHSKAKHLLFVQNNNGDTPLHCASRAGMLRMVSHLIGLASLDEDNTGVDKVKELLEMENKDKETALHLAVRIGNNDIVKLLMEENSELASFPKHGNSPLYLAILLEEDIIVETLYNASHMKLSYSGQNGQNALHAAVLRGTELTKKLLEWNNDLTTQRDENGSTPLHFAAALVQQSHRGSVCSLILEANPAALYQSDNKGLFPIHVAASVGERGTIIMFLKKSTSSAGLQDTMGRTFLHIAAENNKVRIVSFVCRNQSLSWILNMQDYAGNTALHLAIQAGSLLMFCALLGNRQIHLNISNKKGQTALDISRYKIPPGLFDDQNSETRIHYALKVVHARSGNCRRDHFEENYNHQLKHTQREELKNMKESTQTLCIGAVLIATVTFGATFALPGGYRDDEHTNGGTPTLAGRYAFDAFILASTLSFILSAMSIVGLMYSGYSILNPHSRRIYFLVALYFASMSITCFMVAFALGLYMVLAPVAHKSAITIGVISPLVILCNKTEFWIKWALLARPLCTRIGLIRTLVLVTTRILFNTLMEFWPIIFIFVWAAYTRNQF
ncbi:protein ACCELERATED CELL DEATH 6-like [Lolium perenne]|uniref:protein ACCELERATED CELL DEATH 6-like n=1 Tax=Lolium perenne TaxID=4522 RepID=UPI0021F5F65D|nr:ankyrin repeat-containing protein At5g02620-like isoform X1 [Lolium perenne]